MSSKQNKKDRKNPHKTHKRSTYAVSIGIDNKVILTFNNPLPENPITQKSALVDTHKKFIEDIGLEIYAYARMQGYSIYGATLFLALAAQESGYGDPTALDKFMGLNNFFGIDAGKHKFNTQEEGIGYELEKDQGLIHRKYPLLDSLLKEKKPELTQLDEGFKGYNLNPNGVNYATWLSNNIFKGVTQRTINAIPSELSNLQSEMDADKQNISKDAPYLAKAAPWLLNNKDKLGLQAIDELKSEMASLQQIKQEFETGKADTNYFVSPQKPAWLNKRVKAVSNSNTPSFIPPPFTSELEGTPSPSVRAYSQNANALNPLKGTLPSTSIIPGTGDIAKPKGASKNGGGGNAPINNINYQSNENYHTHSNVSTNDIHNIVVRVLTDAVADSKIGTDIH
jgi:hypothetical protein